MDHLDLAKALGQAMGYTFARDADGTERVYRPDGTLAITAVPPKPICPNCASEQLAKVKGCVRCLACGFKADCNGWG